MEEEIRGQMITMKMKGEEEEGERMVKGQLGGGGEVKRGGWEGRGVRKRGRGCKREKDGKEGNEQKKY